MSYKITLLLITKLNNILTGLVNPYNIQYEWPEKGEKKTYSPFWHFEGCSISNIQGCVTLIPLKFQLMHPVVFLYLFIKSVNNTT
jgi:hypothetical protein